MAHLICTLGTESVQDPTKVEVDIIVEIVVFKKNGNQFLKKEGKNPKKEQ